MFDSVQLRVFRDMHSAPTTFQCEKSEGSAPLDWYGEGPANWPPINRAHLSGIFNRPRLIAMQADPEVGTLELCIAVLAWGGMHRNNRDHLFKKPLDAWLTKAEAIRGGKLQRGEAFDALAGLCHQGAITGMRPAYFTKLIYFLMPRDRSPIGYIMDQWLGSSVNLLCGQEVVQMDHTLTWHRGKRASTPERRLASYVSAWNSGSDYENFCSVIECLAAKMGPQWNPETTELTLMSSGGNSPGAWRAYVKEQRLRLIAN